MVLSGCSYPPKQGLYSPDLEKDACGLGFIVKINGERSNKVRNTELLGFYELKFNVVFVNFIALKITCE